MLDIGIGASLVNSFLAELNIPSIGTNTFRRHEEIVGAQLAQQASLSMRKAVFKEKHLTWYVCFTLTAISF
jgi:hypothetical protein